MIYKFHHKMSKVHMCVYLYLCVNSTGLYIYRNVKSYRYYGGCWLRHCEITYVLCLHRAGTLFSHFCT